METNRAILMEAIKELVIASGGQIHPPILGTDYMDALTRVHLAITGLIEASKAEEPNSELKFQSELFQALNSGDGTYRP